MKYKAVIFDMDGLIADTEIIEHKSFEKLLAEYKITPQPNKNGLLHEVGGGGIPSVYFEKFRNQYNLPISWEEVRDKKRAYWKEMVEEELTSYPGFLELLELLQKNKFIIALASNRHEEFIHLVLNKLGVKHYFNAILGTHEDRRPKPYPDIYLQTTKEIGVLPGECVVLEDTDVGVISGNAAGMKVIAVPNIYTKDHDFSKADIIVNSLSEINLKLLNSI